jgi:hypothetical protein
MLAVTRSVTTALAAEPISAPSSPHSTIINEFHHVIFSSRGEISSESRIAKIFACD